MRYPGTEKLEIIQLVEQSPLPARQTLSKLGIPRATFYRWYDRYSRGGPEAFKRSAAPSQAAFMTSRTSRTRYGAIVSGDELETKGLIRRLADPDDRRAHRLRLTQRGQSLRDRLISPVIAAQARILAPLASHGTPIAGRPADARRRSQLRVRAPWCRPTAAAQDASARKTQARSKGICCG